MPACRFFSYLFLVVKVTSYCIIKIKRNSPVPKMYRLKRALKTVLVGAVISAVIIGFGVWHEGWEKWGCPEKKGKLFPAWGTLTIACVGCIYLMQWISAEKSDEDEETPPPAQRADNAGRAPESTTEEENTKRSTFAPPIVQPPVCYLCGYRHENPHRHDLIAKRARARKAEQEWRRQQNYITGI